MPGTEPRDSSGPIQNRSPWLMRSGPSRRSSPVSSMSSSLSRWLRLVIHRRPAAARHVELQLLAAHRHSEHLAGARVINHCDVGSVGVLEGNGVATAGAHDLGTG